MAKAATISKKDQDSVIVIDTRSRWWNVALIIICFVFLLGFRLQMNPIPTGDEPHYLIMDYSLIHDHDLSLANNYGRNVRLGLPYTTLYYQGWPHVSAKYANKQYSTHGFGLPVVLLPGFLFGQSAGAIIEMVLVATVVVWLTWRWTVEVTKSRKAAYFTAFVLSICYFFATLVGAIYPDMLIAALILITLICIERGYFRRRQHQLLLGIVLGFLVLVHLKAIVISLPALGVISYKFWRSDRKLPWVAIIVTLLFIAYYFLTLHQWFGVWSLSQVEGGQAFDSNPFRNVSAMLFDANRGLLVYSPVLLLITVGLPLWLKKYRNSLVAMLLVVGPTMAVLSIIPNWNGSVSPTGRYVMEFLPAFMPALALAAERLREVWQRTIVGVLTGVTLIVTLDAMLNRFPIILNNDVLWTRSSHFIQLQQITGVAFDRFLPQFSNTLDQYGNKAMLFGRFGKFKVLACYVIVSALLIYGFRLAYQKDQAKKLRSA